MSVSYKGLKFVLCILELGPFEYTPLSVSLKPPPLSFCVCVLKYVVFFKNKNQKKKKKKKTSQYRYTKYL